MYYDDVFVVFGSIEEQLDQVAAVLNSKSLEPKSIIQQAFRCAMTTRPHVQSTITERQFYDFAYFSGYANGSPLPQREALVGPQSPNVADDNPSLASASPSTTEASYDGGAAFASKHRLFRRIGREELHRIFDVCVRSQGVMSDHAFALAVAHMHLLRHIADAGRVPEVGSKSMRMTLSEAADLLSAYVGPRVQPFPFPTEYFELCSTPLRCLWKYSEGLETFFRHYSVKDVFDAACCESCMVDIGVIPQLSPQTVERLFQQTFERHPDASGPAAGSEEGGDSSGIGRRVSKAKERRGISMDGFLELLARIAATLYADDVFSRRITLESKIEHLVTTVLGAAYANLYGTPLPMERDDIPNPVVTAIHPTEVDETVSEVWLTGAYFGALGRGLFVASSLHDDVVHVPQRDLDDAGGDSDGGGSDRGDGDAIRDGRSGGGGGVRVPLKCRRTVPWDRCVVVSPLPRIFNFLFKHNVRMLVGNTPEDVLHRVDCLDVPLVFAHSLMTLQLSDTIVDMVEVVFNDGCSQLAYNKGFMYDFCWEYVCAHYCIGAMVSLAIPCALGISLDATSGGALPTAGFAASTLLMKLFAQYAKWREQLLHPSQPPANGVSNATSPFSSEAPPRCALSLQGFTEILARMAMATGCTVDAAEDVIKEMLAPMPTRQSRSTSKVVTMGDDSTDPLATSRRGSIGLFVAKDGERRNSEFGMFEEYSSVSMGDISSSTGGFRNRAKSFKDNESLVRSVVTEQRVLKVLRQNNSELKSKLEAFEATRLRWRRTRESVQTTMAQLRGLLELVLPPDAQNGVQIASKLAVVYRRQLLDICEGVGNAMDASDGSDGSSGDGVDTTALKAMVQQHIDALTNPTGAGAQGGKSGMAGGGGTTGRSRLQAQLSLAGQSSATAAAATAMEVDPVQRMVSENAALQLELAQQQERTNDLRELLNRAHQDAEVAKEESATVRSTLAQLKAQHQNELQQLRNVASDRTERAKLVEAEKAKVERVIVNLEAQLQQRKFEVGRLETLHKQQEDAIESLSSKLSDAIMSKNMQALHVTQSEGGDSFSWTGESKPSGEPTERDAPVTAPPATAARERREDSSSSSNTRRKSSSTNKWSMKKKQASTEATLTSTLLLKELEGVRATEKEFLRNRVEAVAARLDQEVAAHQATNESLETSLQRAHTLRLEVRRLADALKDIGRMTEESMRRGRGADGPPPLLLSAAVTPADKPKLLPQAPAEVFSLMGGNDGGSPNAGSDQRLAPTSQSDSPGSRSDGALVAGASAVGSTSGCSVGASPQPPSTLAATDDGSSTAIQLHILQTIRDALGGTVAAILEEAMETPPDAAQAPTNSSFTTTGRPGAAHSAQPASFSSIRHTTSMRTPVARLVEPDQQQQGMSGGSGSDASPSSVGGSTQQPSKWGAAMGKVSAVSALQRSLSYRGRDSPRTPSQSALRTASSSAHLRKQSSLTMGEGGLARGERASVEGEANRPPSEGGSSPRAPLRPSSSSSSRSGGSGRVLPPMANTSSSLGVGQQNLDTRPITPRPHVIVERCKHCDHMKQVLTAHHTFTTRCLAILKDDLETLRISVALDLREGFAAIQERGELIAKAAHYAPLIVSHALKKDAAGTKDRQLPPNGGGLPAVPGSARGVLSDGGTLEGREITIPGSQSNKAALPSTTTNDRMQRLEQALSLLAPHDAHASPGAGEGGLPTAVGGRWVGNDAIVSKIPDASPLCVLKGDHVASGATPPPPPPLRGMDKHWLGDDNTDLPPSPFVPQRTLRAGSRRQSEGDATSLYVGVAPTPDEVAGNVPPSSGGLHLGHTPSTSAAHEAAQRQIRVEPTMPQRPFEGAVRYKVLVRDKETGDVGAVDADPPPSRAYSRGGASNNLLPPAAHRKTRLWDGTPSRYMGSPSNEEAAGADDEEPAFSDTEANGSRIAGMVMSLLSDAAKRGGTGRAPLATALTAPAPPQALPHPATSQSSVASASDGGQPSGSSRLGTAGWPPPTSRSTMRIGRAVSPPLSVDAGKLNRVRAATAVDVAARHV